MPLTTGILQGLTLVKWLNLVSFCNICIISLINLAFVCNLCTLPINHRLGMAEVLHLLKIDLKPAFCKVVGMCIWEIHLLVTYAVGNRYIYRFCWQNFSPKQEIFCVLLCFRKSSVLRKYFVLQIIFFNCICFSD